MPGASKSEFFDKWQMGVAQDLQELKTKNEVLEKETELQRIEILQLTKDFAEVKGIVEGALPGLRVDTKRAFDLIGEKDETAQLYYGQFREMASNLENLDTTVQTKADAANLGNLVLTVQGKADTETFEQKIKNLYIWLRFGFVGVVVTGLLWVLYLVAVAYGVKKP